MMVRQDVQVPVSKDNMIELFKTEEGEVLCGECISERGYQGRVTPWTLYDWMETVDQDDEGKMKAAPSKCHDCGEGELCNPNTDGE